MADRDNDVPFEGGSQPVEEHATPPPAGGQNVVRIIAIILGVLAVLAGLAWLIVPILSA